MGRGAEREAQRIDIVAHALLRLPMLRIADGVVAARQRIRGKESTPRAAFSGLAKRLWHRSRERAPYRPLGALSTWCRHSPVCVV
jgi:hypothetical protein